MAGRILGWLMVCDPPRQSAAEIARHVGASKGSISTMTRLLVASRIVERFTVPGERVTYYRVADHPWVDMMHTKTRFITAFREVADRGLDLLSDQPPESRRRLEVMRDTYAFFEREFPKLVERLEQERKERGRFR
jgi:DNA-binding transcriptional regulator GbsR (MarR family)